MIDQGGYYEDPSEDVFHKHKQSNQKDLQQSPYYDDEMLIRKSDSLSSKSEDIPTDQQLVNKKIIINNVDKMSSSHKNRIRNGGSIF